MTNKLIISDNLIALQKMEAESIDCVYTDPPYLTGNAKLTYKDNKSETEWILFMQERLIECQRIMKKTATLLIHIDENMHIELANLCYQVFGKKNHITTFVWKKKSSSSAQSKFATVEHEYIIAVAKDIKHCKWNGIPQFEPNENQRQFTLDKSTIIGNGNRPNQQYSLYMVNASSPNQSYPLYVEHGNDPADTDSLFDQHGASREKGNDNNKYPLYVRHGDDKNDITTELKMVGNIIAGYQKNQDYPLYVSEDDRLEGFKKHNLVGTNTENSNYPLYVSEGSGWKNKPHFEIHEDGYGQYYHHPQCSTPAAGKARPKSDDTYPLYVSETEKHFYDYEIMTDGYGEYRRERLILGQDSVANNKENNYSLHIEQDVYDAQRLDKVSKTDRNPETRPEAVYPLYYNEQDQVGEYTLNGTTFEATRNTSGIPLKERVGMNPNATYPLHADKTKISLTPFPGSVEIKPMNGKDLGCWRCIPATCQKLIDANMLVVKKNKKGEYKIYQKQYAHYQFNKKTGQLEPFIRTTPIRTILQGDDFPTNLRSNKEIKEIFGRTAFTYSKPTELVKNLLKIVCNEGDIVLDIFAGSGTTGQAAFEINRKFILIQLDENDIPTLTQQRLNKMIGKESYCVEDK